MAKDNDLIYGVYDRTRGVGGCDDYFGYFKKESDARTEMKAQFEHLKTKNPKETLKLHKDRVVRMSIDRCFNVIVLNKVASLLTDSDWKCETTIGSAIFFANDYILCNVTETTCEVTRVSGTKCGICQTLTSTVG